MKFSTYLVSIVAVWLLDSCDQQKKVAEFDGKVKINGQLHSAPGGVMKLSLLEEEKTEEVTEISIDAGGLFEYLLELDGPGFYVLDLMGEKQIRLALYDEDVEIDFDFSDKASLKVSGSVDSEYVQQIENLMLTYQEEINGLNSEYFEAMNKRDQDAVRDIQRRAMSMEDRKATQVKELLSNIDGSFAALAGLPLINPKKDFLFLDELVARMNEKYPDYKPVQELVAQLEDMRLLAVGQIAPEISLPDPEGNIVNLSDLRGKYVLIDFWAAWCGPCRQENPNVVRLYNQYRDQGFEVFGVSLDRTKEAWVKAIADDELTWTHVSDLKYFNSEAASLYQINAIPATYMLDPEGRIIAKDLRGPSLEGKLQEIFE